jgi:hypothetical protein
MKRKYIFWNLESIPSDKKEENVPSETADQVKRLIFIFI